METSGTVLLLVEHVGDHLRTASLPAITFGREAAARHGGGLILLLIGPGASAAAADAATYGAQVLTVEGPGLEHPLAETWAPIIARIAREQGASVVAATATSTGKDVLPRVAALLDAGMASDVTGIAGPRTFQRPMQAGNIIARIEVATAIVVASVRQTAFPPAHPVGAAGAITAVAAGPIDPRGAAFVSLSASDSARPELTDAKIIVSGGRGMREGKNFKILEELTDLLGGAIGASRAATDAGLVPSDWQVGQTGKVVAPELYIAVAISGAIQHLAGMKGSKVIVAINKDPEAPIFQVADYGLVTTWEVALPTLIAEVKKLKAAQL
ncbi:MAG: electron transfer flavoprotein subunit alpha/FixB family protein [Myxococcales bacterium]|nr:electron transfer flavoprotein subunit alpha/FixB family protein [Myxococcales bacterium]